jgi:hypothetical protein
MRAVAVRKRDGDVGRGWVLQLAALDEHALAATLATLVPLGDDERPRATGQLVSEQATKHLHTQTLTPLYEHERPAAAVLARRA